MPLKSATELVQPEVLTPDTIAGFRVTAPAAEGYINMLVYGESGAGKTRLAGSACAVPEMSPVLLIDFEGGTLSLASDYSDVQVIRVTSWGAVDRLYGALYDKNPYKTIVMDSLSEIQKFSMAQIMKAVIAKDSERDPEVPSIREWGKNSEQIRRLVRALRDLPCNTIFTALANEDHDDRTNTDRFRPLLPGKLKSEVSGYVDIVGYLYRKEFGPAANREVKTLMLTQGTERHAAKDRTGCLPSIMEEPTMRDIFMAMNGRKVA
jgi:hypothetical protein